MHLILNVEPRSAGVPVFHHRLGDLSAVTRSTTRTGDIRAAFTISSSPKPVSASARMGNPDATAFSRMILQNSGIETSPTSAWHIVAVTPAPETYSPWNLRQCGYGVSDSPK